MPVSTQFPYIIYGTVTKDGVPQSSVEVTISLLHADTWYNGTVTTDANGFYALSLADRNIYTDGYSENDLVSVSVLGHWATTAVTGTGGTPPTAGKQVNFTIVTTTKTVSGNSRLMGTETKTLDANAYLKTTTTQTIDANTRVRGIFTRTVNANAYIKPLSHTLHVHSMPVQGITFTVESV